MNNTDKNNIFRFYKAFMLCPDETVRMQITGLSQEEADTIFKDKKISLNFNKCKKITRIEEESDAYYKSIYDAHYNTTDGNPYYWSECIYNGLKEVKVKTQKVCSFDSEWPFNEMYLINNTYLITGYEGYYFVFMKSEETQGEHKEEEKVIIRNNTFTSPITHEMQIPDDFFKK